MRPEATWRPACLPRLSRSRKEELEWYSVQVTEGLWKDVRPGQKREGGREAGGWFLGHVREGTYGNENGGGEGAEHR